MGKINKGKYKQGISAIAAGRLKMPPPFIDPATGCYIALGSKPDEHGYVRIAHRHQGRHHLLNLHTLAFLYANRNDIDALPRDVRVCHKDVCGGLRSCYNPDHLYMGIPAVGKAVATPFKRQRYGRWSASVIRTKRPRKLNEEDVRAIRARFATGAESYQSLADEYGIHAKGIRKIIKRKTYAWVEDDSAVRVCAQPGCDEPPQLKASGFCPGHVWVGRRAQKRVKALVQQSRALSEDDVRAILNARSLPPPSRPSFQALAAKYGVSHQTIGRVARRETYAWVARAVGYPLIKPKANPPIAAGAICVYDNISCGELAAERVARRPLCAVHAKAARRAQKLIRLESAAHAFAVTDVHSFSGGQTNQLTRVCGECGYVSETTHERRKRMSFPGYDMRDISRGAGHQDLLARHSAAGASANGPVV